MEAQMYLPAYMREVAQSGNLNDNQHASYVELLADFAEKRDKEFYALRNERNNLKAVVFQLGEDKSELLAALKKVAQSLEWYAHGRCRGFDDGAPLPTSEAIELAERTLAKVRA